MVRNGCGRLYVGVLGFRVWGDGFAAFGASFPGLRLQAHG